MHKQEWTVFGWRIKIDDAVLLGRGFAGKGIARGRRGFRGSFDSLRRRKSSCVSACASFRRVSGFVPGSCFTTTVLPARVGRLDSGELDFAESFSLPFSFFAAGRFAGMFLDNPDG
jgi:hypothetical protein